MLPFLLTTVNKSKQRDDNKMWKSVKGNEKANPAICFFQTYNLQILNC